MVEKKSSQRVYNSIDHCASFEVHPEFIEGISSGLSAFAIGYGGQFAEFQIVFVQSLSKHLLYIYALSCYKLEEIFLGSRMLKNLTVYALIVVIGTGLLIPLRAMEIPKEAATNKPRKIEHPLYKPLYNLFSILENPDEATKYMPELYMACDNDLMQFAERNIEQMKAIPTPDDLLKARFVHIAVAQQNLSDHRAQVDSKSGCKGKILRFTLRNAVAQQAAQKIEALYGSIVCIEKCEENILQVYGTQDTLGQITALVRKLDSKQ